MDFPNWRSFDPSGGATGVRGITHRNAAGAPNRGRSRWAGTTPILLCGVVIFGHCRIPFCQRIRPRTPKARLFDEVFAVVAHVSEITRCVASPIVAAMPTLWHSRLVLPRQTTTLAHV
jgi:hypothetical protein